MYLRDGSAQTILRAATLEIEVADPTFYLTQSQYTDTGPTSPSADPITPGKWQGSHWSANFEVTGMTRPRKKSRRKRDSNPGPPALEADALPLGQRGGDSEEDRTRISEQRALRTSKLSYSNPSASTKTNNDSITTLTNLLFVIITCRGCVEVTAVGRVVQVDLGGREQVEGDGAAVGDETLALAAFHGLAHPQRPPQHVHLGHLKQSQTCMH